jgi:hypothetical protein
MGAEAKVQDQTGSTEGHGLSLLDVAKHGVKTIIHMMSEHDRLSIVAFSHHAQVVCQLALMNEAGKKQAEAMLNNLMPGGGTNLWNGLHLGLETLREDEGKRKTDADRADKRKRFAHVMLLTDGESQQRDQIIPNMQDYKQKHEELRATINTFGFGYNIDSRLLSKISTVGNGSYFFIPDAGFVGTAFVNMLSNLLATFATEVHLSVEPEGYGEASPTAEILEFGGQLQVQKTDWGVRINVGTMQYGQTKDIVLFIKTNKPGNYLACSAQYLTVDCEALQQVEAVEGGLTPDPVRAYKQVSRLLVADGLRACANMVAAAHGQMFGVQFGRNLSLQSGGYGATPLQQQSSAPPKKEEKGILAGLCSCLSPKKGDSSGSPGSSTSASDRADAAAPSTPKSPGTPKSSGGNESMSPMQRSFSIKSISNTEAQSKLEEAQELMANVGRDIRTYPSANDPVVLALLEDVDGQTTEALSCSNYYWKWGLHYIQSLMFAHALQQCANFKDPGIQHYGGKLFQELRDQADQIFDGLPPPVPTMPTYRMGGGVPGGAAPVVSMAAYNDRNAGCFDGNAYCTMASGEERRVCELRKGDMVQGLDREPVEILCVVRTAVPDGRAELVELPGSVPGEGLVTPYHPALLEDEWVFPADVADAMSTECAEVYTFLLAGNGPALRIGGVPCVALGHGLKTGAAAHPYFGTQRVVDDLSRCKGFSLGFVDLPPGAFQRDPSTGLVCALCHV